MQETGHRVLQQPANLAIGHDDQVPDAMAQAG